MGSEQSLRRKWTFRAGGRQIILVKNPQERAEHVLVKGLIWSLYLPAYPEATIEPPSQRRYKPDVAAFAPEDPSRVVFWGESGHASPDKLAYLFKHFPDVHFALGKWDVSPQSVRRQVEIAASGAKRRRPIDCLCFPPDGFENLVGPRGELQASLESTLRFRWWNGSWLESFGAHVP